MPSDIRKHPRAPIASVRVSWQDLNGAHKFARGGLADLSRSGIRIEVPEAVPVRSYVAIQAETVGLTTNASVRHCSRIGGKFVVGLGFSSPINTDGKTGAALSLLLAAAR